MAKFSITQTVEYSAEEIEADTQEDAMEIYWRNQESYYVGVVEETIEEEEEEE